MISLLLRNWRLIAVAAGALLIAGLLFSWQHAAFKRGERLGYAEAQAAHQAALQAAQAAVDAVAEEQRQAAAELAAARAAITEHLQVLSDEAFAEGNQQCRLPPSSIARLNLIAGFSEE